MTTAHHARRRPAQPRASLQNVAPPLLALVVSSPAIVSGLDGTTSPLGVFTVVAVSMSAIWMLFAAAAHLGGRAPALEPAPASPTELTDSTTGVTLGRIEPVRVPASEAIAGTPPPSPSTEGPVT